MRKHGKEIAKRGIIVFFAAAVLLGLVYGIWTYRTREKPVSESALVLDTLATITLYGNEDTGLIDRCFDLCRKYELIFSRTDAKSELYRLNQSGTARVSDDLLHVLKTALYYCRLSGGKFDITTGKLSDLYGFATEHPTVPTQNQLAAALKHVGYQTVLIQGNQVTLKDPEAELDLGAIAKGYIADRLKAYLLDQGVKHGVINLGGNVLCVGGKPGNRPFTIGIQYPFEDVTRTITNVKITDESVVTSGVYERYFRQNGVLYHHILDPATGKPCRNGLVSVSIVGKNSEACDALSTVTFLLGLEKGMQLINQTKGVSAVFVTEDDQLHYSNGFPK